MNKLCGNFSKPQSINFIYFVFNMKHIISYSIYRFILFFISSVSQFYLYLEDFSGIFKCGLFNLEYSESFCDWWPFVTLHPISSKISRKLTSRASIWYIRKYFHAIFHHLCEKSNIGKCARNFWKRCFHKNLKRSSFDSLLNDLSRFFVFLLLIL